MHKFQQYDDDILLIGKDARFLTDIKNWLFIQYRMINKEKHGLLF